MMIVAAGVSGSHHGIVRTVLTFTDSDGVRHVVVTETQARKKKKGGTARSAKARSMAKKTRRGSVRAMRPRDAMPARTRRAATLSC